VRGSSHCSARRCSFCGSPMMPCTLTLSGKTWRGEEPVLGAVARMLDRWRPLFKEKELRDGLLHWGSGAAWAKTAENCVDEQFRVGDIFFYAVPSGLRRCTLFRRLCRSLVLFLVARELLQLNLYRAGRLKTLLFHALKIVYRNLFSKKKLT